MTRKKISAATKLASIYNWCSVECPKCKGLFHSSWFEFDHMTPLALGGRDDATNIEPLCKACHAKKTNGTKATCASGDIHKIAKAKRLEIAQAAHEVVVRKEQERAPGKIRSRGFDKSLSRKVSGETVRRG